MNSTRKINRHYLKEWGQFQTPNIGPFDQTITLRNRVIVDIIQGYMHSVNSTKRVSIRLWDTNIKAGLELCLSTAIRYNKLPTKVDTALKLTCFG